MEAEGSGAECEAGRPLPRRGEETTQRWEALQGHWMRALLVKPWGLMIKTSKNHLSQVRRMVTSRRQKRTPLEPRDPRDARQALGFDLLWQVLRVVCRGQRPRTQRGQAGYIREAGQLSVKSMVSGVRLPAPPLTGCVTLGKLLSLSVLVPHL